MIQDILYGAVAVTLLVFGLRILRVGYLVLRGNSGIYERNRERVGTIWAPFAGKVPTKFDGARDDLVAAGVAIDLKENKWVEQGRLSDEALQDALAH